MPFDLIDSQLGDKLLKSMSEFKNHLQKEAQEKYLNQWVTGTEACKKLKVCSRTLFEYRKKGIIKYSQFGRKILYKLSDLEDFIQKGYR